MSIDKVCTQRLLYSWDEEKNQKNIAKHGISFEEASSVFSDDHALLIADLFHSDEEERFIALGISNALRVLYVCHCYRDGDVIRIISARKATKHESELYEGNILNEL